MIASEYKLNRKDIKKLNIFDSYSLHRIVYKLFPFQLIEKKVQRNGSKGFLFVDKGMTIDYHKILILSEYEPISPIYGKIKSQKISETFLKQDYYEFEITLNPTLRDKDTRKTVAVYGKQGLLRWFILKALKCGFRVNEDDIEVQDIGKQQFNKRNNRITHNKATFKGKLKVIDRTTFIESFKYGIGRARGFGFGMLQIIPLQIS